MEISMRMGAPRRQHEGVEWSVHGVDSQLAGLPNHKCLSALTSMLFPSSPLGPISWVAMPHAR